MDIDTHSSPRGGYFTRMDLRWVLCVASGAFFTVLLLGSSWIAYPSASFFLLQYFPATQSAPPRFAYLISGSAGDAGRHAPLPPRALPPTEPLHPSPVSGGARFGPRWAGGVRGRAPGPRRCGERVRGGEGQPGDLPGNHDGHHHTARGRHLPARPRRRMGLVHQPLRLRLPARHAGRSVPILDGQIVAASIPGKSRLTIPAGYSQIAADLMDVFSRLPRDLNFIEHTADLGWKAPARAMPVVVDRGLYMKKKQDLMWMNETEKRELPTAFTLFTGSAWMVLSRSFVEYLIGGWDNLPRTVLLYYANFVSSPEGYFQTLVCNAEEFHNTTVNHDMHYISWDDPPGQHPQILNASHWDKMVGIGAPFARKFGQDDMVLDMIDADLLSRSPSMPAPGAWCAGDVGRSCNGPCHSVRNPMRLRPGPGAARVQRLVTSVMLEKNFRSKQCKIVEHSD